MAPLRGWSVGAHPMRFFCKFLSINFRTEFKRKKRTSTPEPDVHFLSAGQECPLHTDISFGSAALSDSA